MYPSFSKHPNRGHLRGQVGIVLEYFGSFRAIQIIIWVVSGSKLRISSLGASERSREQLLEISLVLLHPLIQHPSYNKQHGECSLLTRFPNRGHLRVEIGGVQSHFSSRSNHLNSSSDHHRGSSGISDSRSPISCRLPVISPDGSYLGRTPVLSIAYIMITQL